GSGYAAATHVLDGFSPVCTAARFGSPESASYSPSRSMRVNRSDDARRSGCLPEPTTAQTTYCSERRCWLQVQRGRRENPAAIESDSCRLLMIQDQDSDALSLSEGGHDLFG